MTAPSTRLDRRIVLGAIAVGLAGLPTRVRAAGRHDAKVGEIGLTVLSDGELVLPPSLVLPSLKREDVEAVLGGVLPAEGFRAQTNVTLLTSGANRILVDTGGGTNFQASLGQLPAQLEAAGIAPDSITHVVFTHAHPDHLWGAIDEFDEPRFAKAQHVISQGEWAFWTNPETVRTMPEGLQSMAAGAARILKILEPRLQRRNPGDEVAPGVSLVDTAGHSPGHVSLMLTSGRERLLVGGDVLTHERVSFARPDWEWGTDWEPARAVKARRATLGMLAADDVRLAAYHLPWPGIGRVERAADAFRFIPS